MSMPSVERFDPEAADPAESSRLAEAIARLLPAIERFNRFEGIDPAVRGRDRWVDRLEQALPEQGAGLDEVLRELAEVVVPHGLRNGAPGFSGWVTTAPTTAGAAASLAATVAGSQRWWVQPFNYLEGLALRWLASLLGLPPDWQGTFTAGGSSANLVALGAARQRAFERLGLDPAQSGLTGTAARIYASTEVHHVVNRAAAVLGLGRAAVRGIAVDGGGRIDLGELRRALVEDRSAGILPVALVATAGTVNTGAVDPIAPMADLAGEFGSWLHVDGAYGLFGRLDKRVASLYDGLERADSAVVDPHKWLATPVGIGAAFVRDRGLLGRAFTLEPAEYLEGAVTTDAEIRSPFDSFGELFHDFNLDQSAPSRGAVVWAVLLEIGADGVRRRVRRHRDFASRLAELVMADARLELLAPPTLSICCFRYRPTDTGEATVDVLNSEIVHRLRAETRYVPSTTRIAGRLAIRPCYINPRTTWSDVEGMARAVREIGDQLTAGRSGTDSTPPASRKS
ncbi:MAG: pyridoxal phosphate-dependent decarboxylase family protein [Chloroflexota bacterium]